MPRTRGAPLVTTASAGRVRVSPPAGGLPALIRALSDPALYPGRPTAIEVRQTHASCVFLTPTDVYKLKKPVDLGFLDYSTLPRRARMCRREVELNRRLAPSVYLDVERLVRGPQGGLRLGGSGRTVDYLVHMRRLPDEAALSAALAADAAGEAEVRRVATLVARFHSEAPVVSARFGAPRRLRREALDNFRALENAAVGHLSVPLTEKVREHTDAFFRDTQPLLEARARAGHVRECHGDLRAEHVYLMEDGVAIIDCVEFSRALRCIDTAVDIAFLVMDLVALGEAPMAVALTHHYRAAGEDLPEDLLAFACGYRAMVRCKVAAIRALEPEMSPAARERAAGEAAALLYHAACFAVGERRPQLLLVSGLSGTGKSTLARRLNSALNWPVLSADETRKRLAGLRSGEHSPAALNAGLYSAEMNARVYGELLARAGRLLTVGRSVILDATFRRPADLLTARDLARAAGARFAAVECVAPDEVVRRRLDERSRTGGDPWSDATWEIYRAQRAARDAAPQPDLVLPVSTVADVPLQLAAVFEHLAGLRPA